MDLSPTVLQGLQVAGASSIGNKAFAILLSHSIETVLGVKGLSSLQDNEALSKVDQGQLKEAYSALTTLVIEAAKADVDGDGVSSTLEECKFAPDRIDVFKSKFMENKTRLRASLRRVTSTLPHVVDVDWRLDYYIKGKNVERVNKAVYLINLKTEGGLGAGDGQGNVQFSCTEEQLQDLVARLRDACKSFERIAASR